MTLVEHLILGVFDSLLGRRPRLTLDRTLVTVPNEKKILPMLIEVDISLVKFCEIPKLNRLGRHGAGANEKKSPVLDTSSRRVKESRAARHGKRHLVSAGPRPPTVCQEFYLPVFCVMLILGWQGGGGYVSCSKTPAAVMIMGASS